MRKAQQPSGGSYEINERYDGPFTRTIITLTSSINDDNITTKYENGLLQV